MKAIYVGDPMGELKTERDAIEIHLENSGIKVKVKIFESLWEALQSRFDVIFFDWGGMTIGNSVLESNCEHLLEDAHEHPSRDYVMNSAFTKLAMKDAIEMADHNPLGKPANMYLSLAEWVRKQ